MKSKIRKILFVFSLIILCILSAIFPTTYKYVYASVGTDGTIYTDVLEDLQKDSNFNAEDYVVNMTDYSLKVIQVAESNEKELFVYVYQACSPNNDLTATTINISTSIGENLSYKNYSLSLLNQNGVFSKYKVRKFNVSNDTTRYYDISSIFRKWNSSYDADTGNDNTITEVSFMVGQLFTIRTNENGLCEFANNGTDVVYITEKWCGSCHYDGGFSLLGVENDCDSWFVAFNTDKQINKLLEADVYYCQQSWMLGVINSVAYDKIMPEITTDSINEISKIAHLDYTQVGEFKSNGWFTKKYTWKRISTVEDFIKNEDRQNIYNFGVVNVSKREKINDDGLELLKNKQWVLRFVETEIQNNTYPNGDFLKIQQIVSNVSILRLKFETDNVVYNLGVIDNKQSADLIPDNESFYSIQVADWLKMILGLIMLILIIVLLGPILPILFNLLFTIFKIAIKITLKICLIPFKLINGLLKK